MWDGVCGLGKGNCWPSKNCITIYKSLYWGQLEFLLTKKLHPGNLVEIYCILYGNPLDNRSGTFGKCHAVGTGNVQCRSEVVAGPTVTPTRSECQHGPRLAFARRTNSHNFVTSTSINSSSTSSTQRYMYCNGQWYRLGVQVA